MNKLIPSGSNIIIDRGPIRKELQHYHMQAYVLEEKILDMLQGMKQCTFRKQLKTVLELFLEKENKINSLYGYLNNNVGQESAPINFDRQLRIDVAQFKYQFEQLKLKLEQLMISQN